MNEHLPGYFSWLKQQGARFCHYKVCSTFDSSPVAGNIGKVIEIGRGIFGQRVTPLVVGAPELKRYTVLDPENSPLCLAHGNVPVLDGLEIALKGGQVGGDDYFTALRDGTAR